MSDEKAGRELDERVAREVMGDDLSVHPEHDWGDEIDVGDIHMGRSCRLCSAFDWTCGCPNHDESKLCQREAASYSTSIGLAWLVVEKIKTDKISAELWAPKGDPHWVCRFYDVAGRIIGADGAETAPHAICLAALAAVATSPGSTPSAHPDGEKT